jgi:hypothetical protein
MAAALGGGEVNTHDRILKQLTTPGKVEAAGELPVGITSLG